MSKISQSDITKSNTNKRKIVNDKEEGEESSDDESLSKKQKLNQKKPKKEEDVGQSSKNVSKKRSSKKRNSDSSSSSSSSSDDDSNDEDGNNYVNNDTDEIKLSKTKTRLTSLKQKYEETKHKLEKIERALIKAENENNKENVVKCKKYKKLYDQKVKDIKMTLKQTKNKLDKYVEIVNAKNKKSQIESTQSKKQPTTQQVNEKQLVSKDSSSSLSVQKETKQTQPQPVLKLPFPVLNDTRDFQTILKTLETKFVELQNKKEVNKKSIDTFSLFTSDKKVMEKNQQNLDKLKQLDKSINLLIQRLVKQMDYLKLSLSLESIKSRNSINDSETISRMTHTLGEMYNYMKNENKEYILKQKKLTESNEIESQGNQQPEEPSPMIKLNELYDQVNKALTAVLAHTAACAHSSAAINAYNYSIYYQQQLKLQESPGKVISKEELEQIKSPVVPLVTELKNASSKFSLFKEKISSFFRTTKKITNEKNINTPNTITKKDGLHKLIADYDQDGDDDDHDKTGDESELKIKQPNLNETKQFISKKASIMNLEDDEESCTDDEDDLGGDSILFNDLDKNCDLEIITTSELKMGYYKKRNYLLPSLKAINFPLKASLSFNDPSRFIKKVPDTLIAVEKSKCGLTFLGNSNKYTNCFGQKQNKLYEILYSHQQK